MENNMPKNRKAFLDMIAVSEGTYGLGDDGYNVIEGGDLFQSYADHPRVLVYLPKLNRFSTAAGRYNLSRLLWNSYSSKLHLPDFSPASQDAIAIHLIKECGALEDIDAGRFASAVDKCQKIWDSLLGVDYDQQKHRLEALKIAYVKAGGTINIESG